MSARRRLGVAAAIVDGRRVAGDVEVADGVVAAVGLPGGGGSGVAVPGFVDLQVNGFAGIDLLDDADDDAWHALGAALAATGVLAYQPTFITSPVATLRDGLERARRVAARAAGARAEARILGVHLEGPFLAPGKLGTHPPEHRRDPDRALLEELLRLGGVTTVTLAPELPGALELVDAARAAGAVVSVGHSAATADEAGAAFARGAETVTHLFNAMSGIAAREPGVAGAALARPGVTIQLIVDGVHHHDDTVRLVLAVAGGRLVLVSDAMAAAGLGDGDYRLGTVQVHVEAGRATRADGTLAGSVGTVPGAVRRAVALGLPLERAIAAAAAAPARLLARAGAGVLRVGAPADLVVLDDDLAVARVLRGGELVEAAER